MDRSCALLNTTLFALLLASCARKPPSAGDQGAERAGDGGRNGAGPSAELRESTGAPSVFSGKLSAWKAGGDFIGAGWEGPSGIVIDDLSDISSLQGPEKAVAESLAKELSPRGIVSCADFTYTRRDRPASITLRVFVFKDAEAARAWWNTKYESPEAKPLYQEVDASRVGARVERATDSKQMTKRIVLSRNVLLTCGQLEDNEDHLKVLDRYLRKLEASR